MAGLAGLVFLDGRPAPRALLERLAVESPDGGAESGAGLWHAGSVGLLRFRHAITPGAVSERQPFVKSDSGNVIVFDGRLDNRADLFQALAAKLPQSAPDCVVALHLYEQFGEAFLHWLVGDYALAIWSAATRTLFCARSPLGWRPFLWTFNGARFAFATQPRVLIKGLRLERRLNEGAIGEYLAARFVSPDETFWLGVQRLPGGFALLLKNKQLRTWCWHGGPFPDYSGRSEGEHGNVSRPFRPSDHCRDAQPVRSGGATFGRLGFLRGSVPGQRVISDGPLASAAARRDRRLSGADGMQQTGGRSPTIRPGCGPPMVQANASFAPHAYHTVGQLSTLAE